MTSVTPARSSRLTLILCGLLLLFAVGLQLRNGWMLRNSSLMDSDPPAHFVSGVMTYDYLRLAAGTSPMAFAESYYVRYPKVAIGHWPPAYYAVQAVWYSIFGVHIASVRLLSALIVALLAISLGWAVRRAHGTALAFGSAALLLTSPEVLWWTWTAMSDVLTALFIWLMLLAAVPLLDARPARSDWWAAVARVAWVVAPGVLAILTKGTAWAVAPWLLIAPLFAHRLRALRSVSCWVTVVAIVALGAPFYVMMRASGTSYPVDVGALATAGTGSGAGWLVRFAFLRPVTVLAPTIMLLFALVGSLDAINARWRRGDEQAGVTLALIATAWILAQITFFFLLPLSEDVRAWMPSLAPIILLFARGVSVIQRSLALTRPAALAALGALAAPIFFGGALLSTDFDYAQMNPVEGYGAAASAIPYPTGGTLSLISSDPSGEGAFIAERLIADPARAGVVLRGDQTIAAANWSGSVERVKFGTTQAVRDRLVELQVRYVVLDSSAYATEAGRLLKRAIEEDPATFRPFGRFPVTDRRGWRRGELAIYENPAVGRPRETRVQLGLDRGGRTLVYRWP